MRKFLGLFVVALALCAGVVTFNSFEARRAEAQLQAGNVFQFGVTWGDAGCTTKTCTLGGTAAAAKLVSDSFLTTTLGSASVCCTFAGTGNQSSVSYVILGGSDDAAIFSPNTVDGGPVTLTGAGSGSSCVSVNPSTYVYGEITAVSVTDGGLPTVVCSGADKI